MPTSEQLEQKSKLIAQKEAKLKAEKDSIKMVQDSIKKASEKAAQPIEQKKLKDIENKYLIVVGTFLMQKNIDRCIEKYATVLDTPFTIKRWDDMTMIVVGQAPTIEQANAKLGIVQKECPEAWIYTKR